MADYLRCKWCEYRVLKYRTLKDGRVSTGWKALSLHVEDRHPEQRRQLDSHLESKPSPEMED